MKWSVKNILKPDWRKIILTIVLGYIFSSFLFCTTYFDWEKHDDAIRHEIVSPEISLPGKTTECGLPFRYLKKEAGTLSAVFVGHSLFWVTFRFPVSSTTNLIMNLLGWYFFSCIIIHFRDRRLKRSDHL